MAEDLQQDDQTSTNNDVTIEQLQSDLDQAMNGWKRAQADFDNYRRRTEEQSQELISFAKETVIVKLLPALDALEQALKHLPEYSTTPSASGGHPSYKEGNRSSLPPLGGVPSEAGGGGNDEFSKKYQNWQTGVSGIVMQLDKTLEELGVKKIEAVGKKFDPHFHEAVREVEGEEDGIVVEEYQTGFELNGKVIRPSQVVISKKS